MTGVHPGGGAALSRLVRRVRAVMGPMMLRVASRAMSAHQSHSAGVWGSVGLRRSQLGQVLTVRAMRLTNSRATTACSCWSMVPCMRAAVSRQCRRAWLTAMPRLPVLRRVAGPILLPGQSPMVRAAAPRVLVRLRSRVVMVALCVGGRCVSVLRSYRCGTGVYRCGVRCPHRTA